MDSTDKRTAVQAACVVVATLIASSPLLFPATFHAIAGLIPAPLGALAWLAIPITPWLCVRALPNSTRTERVAIGLFALVLGIFTAEIHHELVDLSSIFPGLSNRDFQLDLHKSVLAGDPGSIPHSYRFLPDTLTEVLGAFVGDFDRAKMLYRIVFQTLLVFALYLWASLILDRRRALLPPLMYALVYPMTNVSYAGQLTDPMSHLSFLLCFIFIELRAFRCLLLTIAVGVLAKESVAAMAFAYPFMAKDDSRRWQRCAILIAVALVILFAVRRWIAGGVEYEKISGVGLEHFRNNVMMDARFWSRKLLFTVGVWLPFAVWRWREQPGRLRFLAVFLFIAIFATSAAFSWLRETRNFVPVIFVLVVLATRRLTSAFDAAEPRGARQGTP